MAEIIEEIKQLSREERNKVIELARQAGESRSLSPEELGQLAQRMVNAQDAAESDHLQEEIERGFYRRELHAKIRRRQMPRPLLAHLLTRMRQRKVSPEQIVLLAQWLDTESEVPESKWFKKWCADRDYGRPGLRLPGQSAR